jgi:hypothetical protein
MRMGDNGSIVDGTAVFDRELRGKLEMYHVQPLYLVGLLPPVIRIPERSA